MVCGCNHNQVSDFTTSFLGLGEWGVVVNLLVMGLLGSFTHCTFMCGPFALAISQMRLMTLPINEMTQRSKVVAIISMPYYVGKTLAYVVLCVAAYFVADAMQSLPFVRYFGFTALMMVAFMFLLMGVNSSTHLGIKLEFKWLNALVSVALKRLGGMSQYGIKGLLVGVVLGFIPCGLVVAAVTQAVSSGGNLLMACVAMLAFGFSTIPGLLLTAFAGKRVQSVVSRKLFAVLYSVIMLYNGLMLLNYALNLVV
jgi:sulfite exporter TauE/SafE